VEEEEVDTGILTAEVVVEDIIIRMVVILAA
jgi:hypothetical protein